MSNTTVKNNKELEYQVYLEERKSLIEAIQESSNFYDKTLITLSAGAFGVSLTFIRFIAPNIKPETINTLFIAWVAFCVSMLLTLISYSTSQRACLRQIEILEKQFLSDGSNEKELKNNLARLTEVLNLLSIIYFIIGCLSLISFSINNLCK